MGKKYDIFISYSRKDSAIVERYYDYFIAAGLSVWLDKDGIETGDEFKKKIVHAIKDSDVFLFFSSVNSNTSPWTVKEVNVAVNYKKRIIPVKLDITPYEESIMFDLAGLDFFDHANNGFEIGVEKLLSVFGKELIEKETDTSTRTLELTNKEAEIFIETDMDCHVQRFHRDIIIARVGEENVIYLPKGRHKLQFVAVENESINKEMLYEVKDIAMSDFIEVELFGVQEERKEKYPKKSNRKEYLESINLTPKENEHGKWGYVNKKGEPVIPFKFDAADSFCLGNLARVQCNDRYGFIDKDGNKVIPLEYEYVDDSFHNGLAGVKKNGKWGFINETGEIVIPIEYEEKFTESFEGDEITPLKKNGKWGFVNTHGNVVIPFEFEDADPFTEDLAFAKYNGKYGFLDKRGEKVIPFEYDEVCCFEYSGLARVMKDNQWGAIDRQNNIIIPIIYDSIEPFFDEKTAVVRKNKREGIINNEGIIVIPPIYEHVDRFSEDLSVVCLDKKYGYVDRANKIVIPLEYDFAKGFVNGRAQVFINHELCFIDKLGKRIS